MENILVINDAGKLSMSNVDFACYLANLTHSRLTAYFIEKIAGEERPKQKLLFALPYVETITAETIPENKLNAELYAANEKAFADACTNRGINAQILRNRHTTTDDLVKESRFADLIILDPEISMGNEDGKILSASAEHLLRDAECPVMIAPYTFYGIDEILFAYDGSKSSVFAIKQFTHLFPELNHLKVTALQIIEEDTGKFGENDKIAKLIASHYGNIQFKQLKGKVSDQLLGYLLGKNSMVVAMGAYGRGLPSTLFKPSTANLIVKTLNLPVFITHYK